MEEIIEMVRRFVGLDRMISWIGEKLVKEYGVVDMSVARENNSVMLLIKANDKTAKMIEDELRNVVNKMFGKRIYVEVKIDGEKNGSRR